MTNFEWILKKQTTMTVPDKLTIWCFIGGVTKQCIDNIVLSQNTRITCLSYIFEEKTIFRAKLYYIPLMSAYILLFKLTYCATLFQINSKKKLLWRTPIGMCGNSYSVWFYSLEFMCIMLYFLGFHYAHVGPNVHVYSPCSIPRSHLNFHHPLALLPNALSYPSKSK